MYFITLFCITMKRQIKVLINFTIINNEMKVMEYLI